MFKAKIGEKTVKFDQPSTVENIICAAENNFVAALVDGTLTELQSVIDKDCSIVPIGLDNEEGQRVYVRTLKYVFIMAIKQLYPNASVRFLYSISRGLYCEIENVSLNSDIVDSIDNEMHSIIKADEIIVHEKMSISKLEKIFKKTYPEKARLLKYAPEKKVSVYKCGEEYNYLNGAMLPSTGYLKEYKLYFHSPGLILSYPRSELGGKMPELELSVKFDKMLWKAEEWGKICGVREIADLNEKIESGKVKDLVNMCEIKHENDISRITEEIARNIKQTKVILIAGPSSSGKTTLSKRLALHLAVKGINALHLSTDDFFLPMSCATTDEFGQIDLEHINRVDIPLFNNCLTGLIQGREVQLPIYNFNTNQRENGDICRIGEDECVIIEGIHGLNETLTELVPRYSKYKIYISALTHINVDAHTSVSTTTCRMIRRAVRDNLFRGRSIDETFASWPSVRRGEFRWIYPYQEEADFTFNSELAYELAVMKKHIEPLLNNIDKNEKNAYMADKIERIIRFVDDIDDDIVPNTSILREFIGKDNY